MSEKKDMDVNNGEIMSSDHSIIVENDMQASIAAASVYPGFRFSPTDEELISYYLNKKAEGSDKSVGVISEVEINTYEPWDLPSKSLIQSDNEWFFFSPRGRKYPNGSQSKRATESGYWKATGKERNVKSGSNVIGTKRTLVFHTGRAPKGERTEWIMHEYSMAGKSQDALVICRLRRNTDFHLNDSASQSSSTQRNISPDIGSFSLSEISGKASRVAERTKEVDSSSKDHSNNSSHSAKQLDSGNESVWIPTHELSHLASSSHQDKDYEDLYADILKDDIVDLGKTLLPATSVSGRGWQQQPIQTGPLQLVPRLQGTANRRIRLNWETQEDRGRTEPVVMESTNEDSVEEIKNPQPPTAKCVVMFLSQQTVKKAWSYIVSFFFTMLILLLAVYGVPNGVKSFMRML